VVDQVRGGVGHPAPAAGRAEAAVLAGEGNQAVEAAVVAAQARESVCEDPAAQKGAQLLLDEPRHRMTLLERRREEGLELGANRSVEQVLLGVVGAGSSRHHPQIPDHAPRFEG